MFPVASQDCMTSFCYCMEEGPPIYPYTLCLPEYFRSSDFASGAGNCIESQILAVELLGQILSLILISISINVTYHLKLCGLLGQSLLAQFLGVGYPTVSLRV